MKYRPILFSTPMVEAIMDGSKTQTRRTIKPQPDFDSAWKNWGKTDDVPPIKCSDYYLGVSNGGGTAFCVPNVRVPTHINDIFWVRETWAEAGNFASNEFANSEIIAYRTEDAVFYDNNKPLDTFAWNWDKIKWKPSIFMPKSVCRNFLRCTDVRVERLHDISEEDAISEGIKIDDGFEQFHNYGKGYKYLNSAVESFFSLWESINGKQSLDENPWTWVYSFEKIEKPENFK